MSIDLLFSDFDQLIQSSESVHRLRRFILDLAVRGKLAPQDPNDEPASELLKRIALEKARLVKAGEIRKQKILLPVHRGDIPVKDIPGWIWVRLGEVSTVITKGSTPTSYGHAYTKEGVNFVKVESIKGGSLLPKNITSFIGNATHDFLARSQLAAGDILFSIAGSIGTCAVVTDRVLPANTNQALAIIRGTKTVFLAEFLLQLLRSSVAQSVVLKARGGAMSNISLDDIQNFVVPLPPLAEQHRIVAKVGELMVLCDRLEAARAEREATRDRLATASLARLNVSDPDSAKFQHNVAFALNNLTPLTTRPDQIKALRQTILNLAVRGKLVEQDSTEGTGQDLLFELGKARNTWETVRRVRKQKDKNSVVEDEKYLDLPTSWAWARLVNLGQTQTGTSPSSANPELFGDFVPFVKPADLDGNEVNYSGPGLSEKGIAHSRLAPEHSVLMVCIGATLGKVNKTTRSVCFNQQINCLTPFIEGITDFVAFALKASGFQELAWSKAGTGTLPIISKSKWEVLPVPLPPLAEQHRIVARVDELMALFDQLEANLTTGGETQGRLVEAVLHKLLSGDKINPSWPGVGICRNRGEND